MARNGRASAAFGNARVIKRETVVGERMGREIELETFVVPGRSEEVRIAKPEKREPRGWRNGNNEHADRIALELLMRKGNGDILHGAPCTHPECCPGRASLEEIHDYARTTANRHSERAIMKQNVEANRIKRSRGEL